MHDEYKLDDSKFAVGTVGRRVAEVVRSETESARTAESAEHRARYGEPPSIKNAFATLGPEYHDPSGTRPWYEYLTSETVLIQCDKALGMERHVLLDNVITFLKPANWQVFFWMMLWFEQIQVSGIKTAKAIRQSTDEFERRKREIATAGGHAKHAKRFGEAQAFVVEQWGKTMHEYDGNKSAFARVYVTEVKRRFGEDVIHTTIAQSWLKGK